MALPFIISGLSHTPSIETASKHYEKVVSMFPQLKSHELLTVLYKSNGICYFTSGESIGDFYRTVISDIDSPNPVSIIEPGLIDPLVGLTVNTKII